MLGGASFLDGLQLAAELSELPVEAADFGEAAGWVFNFAGFANLAEGAFNFGFDDGLVRDGVANGNGEVVDEEVVVAGCGVVGEIPSVVEFAEVDGG